MLDALGFEPATSSQEGVLAFRRDLSRAADGMSLAELEAEEALAAEEERQQRLIRAGILLALAIAVYMFVRGSGRGADEALILGSAIAAPAVYFLLAALRPDRAWEADTLADLAGIVVVYSPLGAGVGWVLSRVL
jgi:hypothetical protein